MDFSSPRKKLTSADACPFFNSGHSGRLCESDDSVAPGQREETLNFQTGISLTDWNRSLTFHLKLNGIENHLRSVHSADLGGIDN
jgi:hypothetical protein